VSIVASAQLILATAVSGWSPNSPATRAAQPPAPSRCSVAATAPRIWSGEGDPEGCRAARRQPAGAGVGWVAFVRARLRLHDLRHRIGPAPNRSAGPERGYLREGENMETAGHPPNRTGNALGEHGHMGALFSSINERLLLEIRDRELSTA
jgi:hypothetical protein